MKFTGKIWVTVEADSEEEAQTKLFAHADQVKDEDGMIIGSIYSEEIEQDDDDDVLNDPVTLLGVTFSPSNVCENCRGTGIFGKDDEGNVTDVCAFCLEDAIKRGEVEGTVGEL